jgi:uncharacterized protein YdhG (YjbR/CyaY superfamily)
MVRMKKAPAANLSARDKASNDAPAAVEAYVNGFSEPAQTTLRQLREIIRSAVPAQAVELISYGIPAFALPKPFFGYAAFKNHASVLPFSGSLFDSFAEELKPYARTKSSLHLSFTKPLPAPLIRKLVRARLAAITTSTPPKSKGHGPKSQKKG